MSTIALIFSILIFSTPKDHAIYISVVEVTQIEGKAQISVKVFSDDLQDAVRNYAEEKDLSFTSDDANFNKLLAYYFSENLQIEINSKRLSLVLKDTSEENDATFLTFTSEVTKPWKEIDVHAPYFTELFPSQTNTFSIETPSRKYYGKTEKDAPNLAISLN